VSAAARAGRGASLRRDTEAGILGGVCAGLERRTGVDARVLRVIFVGGAAISGIGVAVYLLLWAVVPNAVGVSTRRRKLRSNIAGLQVAAGIGCLVLAGLLLFRDWGLWIGDAAVWPVTLVSAGAALIWRQSQASPEAAVPAPDGSAGGRERRAVSVPGPARARAALGAALVVGGALVFLWLNDALAPARDVILAVVVVVVALALILAPFWLRLVRGLSAERSERIRSQERAEVAAHLHDSVLQTLALVQRRADDPRAVAQLARRQERELRDWLNGGAPAATDSLAAALRAAAAEIEDAHGVPIDVVVVGDRPLGDDDRALTAAAREALTNAAKFAPDAAISLFAEIEADRAEVFVRDRGPGFDPAAVPGDRRGVRESIVGRMERHGGTAKIHAATGEGTEVELILGDA
jgi:signal transduction histidine kinase